MAKAGPDAEAAAHGPSGWPRLGDPSDAQIAEAAGAPAGLEAQTFEVVIVGSGPAGLSAAVYGASEGLRVLVVDAGGIGGQARSSSLIRNYLGFGKGVSGSRLAVEAYEQAASFGASFLFMHRVTALGRSDDGFNVSLSDGQRIGAGAVILAPGASYSRLGIASLEALNGAGVFYGGPTSEARADRKGRVCRGWRELRRPGCTHLARYARASPSWCARTSLETGMSHYLVQAVEAAPNIEVRTGTAIVGGGGDGYLSSSCCASAPPARTPRSRPTPCSS